MFGLFKKKVDKGAWSEVVYGKRLPHPEQESAERLAVLTTGILMQHHRIIIDSVRIAHTTKSAETRRERIGLCKNHYQEMLALKPFCNKEQLAIIQNAQDAMKGTR